MSLAITQSGNMCDWLMTRRRISFSKIHDPAVSVLACQSLYSRTFHWEHLGPVRVVVGALVIMMKSLAPRPLGELQTLLQDPHCALFVSQ